MNTDFAIEKAGSRDKLAELLGVETITTYAWKPDLPKKHVRYLRAVRPRWFKELEQRQAAAPAPAAN